MRLLLDTHALLWWLTDDPKLPVRTGTWIDDRANEIAVSPVSAYELRFKALKGLLPGGDVLAAEIGRMAELAGFAILKLLPLGSPDCPDPSRPFFRLAVGCMPEIHGFAERGTAPRGCVRRIKPQWRVSRTTAPRHNHRLPLPGSRNRRIGT